MEQLTNNENSKELRKKNNKGFSLVELIIVIAIMAILVGVVGTQVLPYMDKSREAKDFQLVSSVCTAATTAFAENADTVGSTDFDLIYTAAADPTTHTDVTADIKQLLGVASGTFTFRGYFGDTTAGSAVATATQLDSKVGKTAQSFKISYDASEGQITVQLYADAAATATPVFKSVISK